MPEPTISDAAKAAAMNERDDSRSEPSGHFVQLYADQSTAQLQQRVAELEQERDKWKDKTIKTALQGETYCANLRSERDAIQAQLDEAKAALELGQINCDAAYNDLRVEREEALAEARKDRTRAETAESDRDSMTQSAKDSARNFRSANVTIAELRGEIRKLTSERDEAQIACVVKDAKLNDALRLVLNAPGEWWDAEIVTKIKRVLSEAISNTAGAALMQELEAAKASFESQRKNYVALCEAVMGEGTRTADFADPVEVAVKQRQELAALKKELADAEFARAAAKGDAKEYQAAVLKLSQDIDAKDKELAALHEGRTWLDIATAPIGNDWVRVKNQAGNEFDARRHPDGGWIDLQGGLRSPKYWLPAASVDAV